MMGLAKETALIRIAVYIVIPTLQRVLCALLDVAQHATGKLDDMGFLLAKSLVSPDREAPHAGAEPEQGSPPAASLTRGL